MKKCIIVVTAIFLISISAYADYECDSKYYEKIKKLNSISDAELSNKSKYISGLEKAYQLCKDGKKEQANEILTELRKDKNFDGVFSTHTGN